MKHHDASWSFLPQDLEQLDHLLLTFLDTTSARCALLVDRSGQLLTFAGDGLTFDGTAFASLAAADFAASDQLAQLLGEDEFKALYHQGEKDSMYLVDIHGRAILAALFNGGTTLGLVRLTTRRLLPEIETLFQTVSERGAHAPDQAQYFDSGWLSEAEGEIDKLFAE
ncbi:MAG TPA: roadblock/LC7 domain-containing protein [Longimicrobiales bacterium]